MFLNHLFKVLQVKNKQTNEPFAIKVIFCFIIADCFHVVY